MKLTLEPESPEDEQRLRERAARGTGQVMPHLTPAITDTARRWVEENPLPQPKPGPGSVLRWNHENPFVPEEESPEDRIRIVNEKGQLIDVHGTVRHYSTGWRVGVGGTAYTVLFNNTKEERA